MLIPVSVHLCIWLMCAHVLSGPVSWDHCDGHANASDSWCGWVCGSVAVACGGVGLPCGFLTTGFTSLAFFCHAFDRAHCTVESEGSQDVAPRGPLSVFLAGPRVPT